MKLPLKEYRTDSIGELKPDLHSHFLMNRNALAVILTLNAIK